MMNNLEGSCRSPFQCIHTVTVLARRDGVQPRKYLIRGNR